MAKMARNEDAKKDISRVAQVKNDFAEIVWFSVDVGFELKANSENAYNSEGGLQ